MKKITAIIKPFIFNQNVYVYEDGNKLDYVECKLDDLSNIILGFSNKYEAYNVEFIGSKKYCKGLGKKLAEKELETYSENKIKIDYV